MTDAIQGLGVMSHISILWSSTFSHSAMRSLEKSHTNFSKLFKTVPTIAENSLNLFSCNPWPGLEDGGVYNFPVLQYNRYMFVAFVYLSLANTFVQESFVKNLFSDLWIFETYQIPINFIYAESILSKISNFVFVRFCIEFLYETMQQIKNLSFYKLIIFRLTLLT